MDNHDATAGVNDGIPSSHASGFSGSDVIDRSARHGVMVGPGRAGPDRQRPRNPLPLLPEIRPMSTTRKGCIAKNVS